MNRFFLHILFVLFATTSAYATSIHSYKELRLALTQGNQFTIVLDLPKCTGNEKTPIGSFSPNALLLMPATDAAPERIVTSLLHLTDHMDEPTYEYMKCIFQSDNSVIVRVVIYDPKTFEPIGSTHLIQGVLGQGVSVLTRD